MTRFQGASRVESEDPIEMELHNLANSLAAVRSYADVLRLRAEKAERARDMALVDSLLDELDRIGRIVRDVRRETHRPGDVLECGDCGYTFVYGKSSDVRGVCKRCRSTQVTKWRPE